MNFHTKISKVNKQLTGKKTKKITEHTGKKRHHERFLRESTDRKFISLKTLDVKIISNQI